MLSDLFLQSWHPYAWLALIPCLLYFQILSFSAYTHYDDYYLIVENYGHIRSLSALGHAFLEDVSHQGREGTYTAPC